MIVATLAIVLWPTVHTAVPATILSGVAQTALTSDAARPALPGGHGIDTPVVVADLVSTLTAQLIDPRTRSALPRGWDLAAIRPATAGPQNLALRPAPDVGADLFRVRRDTTHDSTSHRSVTGGAVTGGAVAFGAPDAGGRGGIGTATLSGAGSGATNSAMINGRGGLAVQAGFTVARHTTGTGTLHASIRPLGRPG